MPAPRCRVMVAYRTKFSTCAENRGAQRMALRTVLGSTPYRVPVEVLNLVPASAALKSRGRLLGTVLEHRVFRLVFPLTYFPIPTSGPNITLRKTPVFHSKLR